MRRFFNWLKAIFNRGMDKLEDPEIMLDQAKRDMTQALINNREKAVQAITQKNRLQGMLEEATRRTAQLESQATMALQQGKRDLALQFMREKANNDATIVTLKNSYDGACVTVDQIKVAIKRQEEEVRKKTAEALALKAQWKNAQIQNSITKALEGLTFENQYGSFEAATGRIRDMQSEAAARQEMMGESLTGKLMAMEDTSRDQEAEIELQKLEQRLGLGAPAAPALEEQTQSVSVGGASENAPPPAPTLGQGMPATNLTPEQMAEADRQLEELEKRIKDQ